jgi:hypothetical protein
VPHTLASTPITSSHLPEKFRTNYGSGSERLSPDLMGRSSATQLLTFSLCRPPLAGVLSTKHSVVPPA